MSKLFWAMLSFITRLPVPRRWLIRLEINDRE
ncbi:hypothetical protein RX21_01081 [Escherichia coli]|nr:hypothetical protein RX21_01081 [Escherichia coli]OYB95322.1 hypothetical protein RX19_04142 [Escherichia coli]